jgi:hypothetical protein
MGIQKSRQDEAAAAAYIDQSAKRREVVGISQGNAFLP